MLRDSEARVKVEGDERERDEIVVRVQCVNEKQQKNLAECCQRLLPKLNDEFVKRIVFSDEKLFLISPSMDSNKIRICTTLKRSSARAGCSHHAPSASVARWCGPWAGVSSNGKTELLFVEPGLKINAEYYVQEDILPSCSHLHRDGSFVPQQDWAQAHASRKTLAFLDAMGVMFNFSIVSATSPVYKGNLAMCRMDAGDFDPMHPCNPQSPSDFYYWETNYDDGTDDRDSNSTFYTVQGKSNQYAVNYVFKPVKPGR
uniref:PKD_channel domain-containing protein n=1 Tax=Haemonchus placei TaxID=6290 RepID=A0A0N4XB34_HAEPC